MAHSSAAPCTECHALRAQVALLHLALQHLPGGPAALASAARDVAGTTAGAASAVGDAAAVPYVEEWRKAEVLAADAEALGSPYRLSSSRARPVVDSSTDELVVAPDAAGDVEAVDGGAGVHADVVRHLLARNRQLRFDVGAFEKRLLAAVTQVAHRTAETEAATQRLQREVEGLSSLCRRDLAVLHETKVSVRELKPAVAHLVDSRRDGTARQVQLLYDAFGWTESAVAAAVAEGSSDHPQASFLPDHSADARGSALPGSSLKAGLVAEAAAGLVAQAEAGDSRTALFTHGPMPFRSLFEAVAEAAAAVGHLRRQAEARSRRHDHELVALAQVSQGPPRPAAMPGAAPPHGPPSHDAAEHAFGVSALDEPGLLGVRVRGVVPGGPCELAGVRGGDVLLEAGAVRLTCARDLHRVAAAAAPGVHLALIVASARDAMQARAVAIVAR